MLQHTGGGVPLIQGRDLAVLAGWAAAGLLASVRFFRWDPHRPGRPGRQAGERRPAGSHPASGAGQPG